MPSINPIQTLDQLIAKVESNNNPFATRIEMAHMPKMEFVTKMRDLCDCSLNTATALCRMSFGLFQIMGDNLISLGLDVSPIEYCASVAKQLDYFHRYCVTNHCDFTLDEVINDTGKRGEFAKIYNGPGNVAVYSARLVSIYNGA